MWYIWNLSFMKLRREHFDLVLCQKWHPLRRCILRDQTASLWTAAFPSPRLRRPLWEEEWPARVWWLHVSVRRQLSGRRGWPEVCLSFSGRCVALGGLMAEAFLTWHEGILHTNPFCLLCLSGWDELPDCAALYASVLHLVAWLLWSRGLYVHHGGPFIPGF